MVCSNTRNVVLMHPIFTPGAVTNAKPGKGSCDKIKSAWEDFLPTGLPSSLKSAFI